MSSDSGERDALDNAFEGTRIDPRALDPGYRVALNELRRLKQADETFESIDEAHLGSGPGGLLAITPTKLLYVELQMWGRVKTHAVPHGCIEQTEARKTFGVGVLTLWLKRTAECPERQEWEFFRLASLERAEELASRLTPLGRSLH
jgi:hypothetical protein